MIVDTALNHLECDPATPPQGNLSSGSSQLDNGAFGIAHNLNITVHEPCCQVGCRTRENSLVCMASPSQSRGVQRIKEGGKQILHSALYAVGSIFVAAGHGAIGIGKIISGIGMLIQDRRAHQDD
ncbi:hypothetical protein AGABI2DRAFT_192303 [Agaricus bisporus var. bisporus H97]|uniref:hypothetical protein n=1 Tax=Agaricus bisporus var. bisporus (strain H97 / ATCC MYA-4626 / FGSC 10389) TaxID=936046 RepID=UPI00029F6806|nr:hypothetical protein AGABI2DRAFT_192303 [Agaricus bisporus var. bisporus H97]EKV47027.1 hypothetical protein AGABI2DRAFT_192303 [Agaricus bisporus var. bisporus H97]